MGYGHWDDDTYTAARTYRRANGLDDFGYTADLRHLPSRAWKVHPTLDPRDAFRESRDSEDHAELAADRGAVRRHRVDGPRAARHAEQARQAARTAGDKGYADDPQILFGGIGDADSDRVPLQIGQFESDNRMDEQLRTIFLEGNGGGQKSESYELAAYFMARHIVTDAWEKRQKKGYLFIIGDELNKPRLSRRHVREVIGDDLPQDVSVPSIYASSRSVGTSCTSCPAGRATTTTPTSRTTGSGCSANGS